MVLRSINGSIGAKIFAAFAVMSLLTGIIGGYGIYELLRAADIIVNTYDGSLMAINYARSANATFLQMDRDELRRELAAPAQRVAIEQGIGRLLESFYGDLRVAKDRSQTAEDRDLIGQTRRLVAQWDEIRKTDDDAHATDARADLLVTSILDRFDTLTEHIADYSFVERRRAVWSISYLEYTSIAGLLIALTAALVITFLLRRRIIKPLSIAANVADRIAGGELQTPIPEGGDDETGVLLRSMRIMRDNVSAMMEREAAQRRSAQNRLIEALESSREGMVLVDADGSVTIKNSEFDRFFPTLAHFALPGSDLSAAFRVAHPRLLDIVAVGGDFQLEDGRWIHCSRSTTQDGGFFLFFSDFTEIKEREQGFKEAKKQAEAASRAKSNFLANMSHELRTPLNAIIGFSEIMSGEMFGALGNPRYNEYSTNILQSGKHLLDIINSVLELSKSDAGKLRLNVETVDIPTILTDCAKMVRPQSDQAELKLSLAWPDEDLTMQGDVAKLRQIFLNLLSNAVKFTKTGGRVALTARRLSNDALEVQITDTGIGMRPEDIPLALSPFGQIDGELARQYEGTGLGLPLSNALIELHNGTLRIDSALGQGTTVTVSLPRRAAQNEAGGEARCPHATAA